MNLTIQFDQNKLEKALNSFPDRLFYQVNGALQLSALSVMQDAKASHRYNNKTGKLTESIKIKKNPSKLETSVGLDTKTASYGNYQHDGTVGPYKIRAKNSKYLRFMGNSGKYVFAKEVEHPGLKPDPFIVNAGLKNSEKIKDMINNALDKVSL